MFRPELNLIPPVLFFFFSSFTTLNNLLGKFVVFFEIASWMFFDGVLFEFYQLLGIV